MKFLLYLMPLWLIKRIYKAYPPTSSFRTTLGRVFRLIRVDDDFCIAVSSEKYDQEVAEKLLKMQQEGQKMIDSAVEGLNMLSYDNREIAMRRKARENDGRID